MKKVKKMKEKRRMGVIGKQRKVREKPALISMASLNGINGDDTRIYIAEVIPEYIKKTMKYDKTDVLQINIKYPQLKPAADKNYEKSVGRINKFYDDAAKYFMKFSETALYRNAAGEYIRRAKSREGDDGNVSHAGFRAFGATLNFEVTYNNNNYLCIYFDANIYVGKGRGSITRKSHIWNLSDGSVVPSDQFVDFSTDSRKKICAYICRIMEYKAERGEEYYINADFKTVYKHLDKRNMFITERGCNFFFPQNSLSPAECGIVSFAYIPDTK